MHKANGYEENAATFINNRARADNTTGTSSVRHWAKTLPADATVLDVGCGPGLPITNVLVDEGLNVYALDASPSLVQAFKQNFPHVPIACEALEDSSFFSRQFDAILAWGLLFLLPEEIQEVAIRKMADALQMGGKLLFTAPAQKARWEDVITLQESVSLGSEKYKELLTAVGLTVIEEFEDEGENHYYSAVKTTKNLA
ncbi:bifunctional 2-polyprenyl-6-hydroxyphenol methylase/3-demethylubiquinol 3-O-methyltransferase UbiG [Dyadobacter sp. Leaf189]|uniref:class I SAM-dependent methyltransferase n=1 Tax=Dyadobacter sp. Leaf189 TaxID=1736295 RepID=UPI0007013F16|nr:class I SAM-dependent methyltransferase [Dyadobacter sp. Leaf189]KQS34248.1 methyltransferase [Dyadobacter sp. Leaf189]